MPLKVWSHGYLAVSHRHRMFSEWLRKWLFYVTASFVLCPPLVCNVVPQRCDQGEYSIFGKMLRGHTFKRLEVSNPVECLQACNADFRCYSFNYVIIQDVCELSNRTREAAPEDFVPNFHRYYFKRNTETGELLASEVLVTLACVYVTTCVESVTLACFWGSQKGLTFTCKTAKYLTVNPRKS